jgi:hypothetical protein
VTRHHSGRGEVNRLLGRAALAIDGGGRHCLWKPGRHPSVTGHIGALLTYLAHATPNDIVHPLGIHTCPFHQIRQDKGQQISRVPMGQRTLALPECRSHHVDDHGFTPVAHHAGSSRPHFTRPMRSGVWLRPSGRIGSDGRRGQSANTHILADHLGNPWPPDV